MAVFHKRIGMAVAILAAFCFILHLYIQTNFFSSSTGLTSEVKTSLFTASHDSKLQEINNFYWKAREKFTDHNSSKWIILMASDYTLQDIEQISRLEGWQLVVVTESEISQTVQKQNVHYVNSEYGAIEGANILPPSSHLKRYARRNIGYVYAMLNGADWIYDIGHGIIPTNETISLFDFGNYTNGLKYRTTHCNSTKTFEIQQDFLEFMISWNCGDKDIAKCMEKLAGMLKARRYFSDEDLQLFEHWVWSLRLHRYGYPTTRSEETGEDHSGSPRHRNCRRVRINLTSKNFWNSSHPDIELAQKKLDYFKDFKKWCGADLPADGKLDAKKLATLHSADPALSAKKDTVLVIINNYPWSRSLGILQRMHEPYFALTIFCGTLNRKTLEEKGYPRTFEDFSYVDIDPTEILRGIFLYHCLSKVAEMRLRNVKGYFVTADDLVWNFWNEVDLDQVYHPLGILKRRALSWYDGPNGIPALKRAARLMTETYKDYPIVQDLLKRYGEGVLKYRNQADPVDYLTSVTGYAASDFFYVPSTEVRFFYDLMQILYEGEVFKGIAVLKFLASVPHNVAKRNRVVNMSGKARSSWSLYYSENLIMMHPVKQSTLLDREEKSKYCYVIVKAFRNMLIRRYLR